MRRAKWAAAAFSAIACAVGCCVVLAGCSVSAASDGAPDPGLRGQWVLTSGSDTFGPMNLLGQDITLSVTSDAVSTGRSSCSDYTATIYGSQRDLWVTTQTPPGSSCATADQSILQGEYLLDLARIRRSAVTNAGLELSAQGVDLRYTRAARLHLSQLVNKTWQLETGATISLHQPFAYSAETGGTLRFDSGNSVDGHTTCEDVFANFHQDADAIVMDNVRTQSRFGCAPSDYRVAAEFLRLFQGGFTFALTRNSLAVKSSRAGITLGFDEEGTP